ncbi:amino acid ABC transporter permease, partial [Streptococcus pyogenes]
MLTDILNVLSPTNLSFLLSGLGLTLYMSAIIIVLSTLLGTILAVMRNGKNLLFRWISSIYI